jgi:hypothetical protein
MTYKTQQVMAPIESAPDGTFKSVNYAQFANDIQNTCNALLTDGFEVVSITPLVFSEKVQVQTSINFMIPQKIPIGMYSIPSTYAVVILAKNH